MYHSNVKSIFEASSCERNFFFSFDKQFDTFGFDCSNFKSGFNPLCPNMTHLFFEWFLCGSEEPGVENFTKTNFSCDNT
jgi:hypothetical protein